MGSVMSGVDLDKVGLIVEGGGLRAMFGAGVLDHFLTCSIHFPYVSGVSAGALYSASYVSRQHKRNLNIQLKYHDDPRYMGMKHLLKTGSYVNTPFTFHAMAKQLVPYDFDMLFNMKEVFEVGAFNCKTGKTDYFSSQQLTTQDQVLESLIATSSLPFISKPMMINNMPYLDGGIMDPIPAEHAFESGCDRLVIILSQHASYRKLAMKMDLACRIACYKYPKLYQALHSRHEHYNKALDNIAEWERQGKVFVIRPQAPSDIARLEKDKNKVKLRYEEGVTEAKASWGALQRWLATPVVATNSRQVI